MDDRQSAEDKLRELTRGSEYGDGVYELCKWLEETDLLGGAYDPYELGLAFWAGYTRQEVDEEREGGGGE